MKEHLKTTWAHIRRSPYQAFSAILIMFLTFFIASVFILTAAGFQGILHWLEAQPQVTAFLEDKITPTQVDVLKAKLAETGKIKTIKYVSKEEALAIYKEQFKKDPLLLDMVTASMLPASLEVSTTDIAFLGEIAEILKNQPGVEEVIFQEDIVKALHQWTQSLRKVGIALVSILGAVSLLIILVIIGMRIALRREEIEILRLIGASAWYIRAPFIFEGIFYGVIGAILGWGVSFLLVLYSTPFLVNFLSGIPILPVPLLTMLMLLGAEVTMGVLIGSLGSLAAVKRYLK
jgi:cell division transport system permease protein